MERCGEYKVKTTAGRTDLRILQEQMLHRILQLLVGVPNLKRGRISTEDDSHPATVVSEEMEINKCQGIRFGLILEIFDSIMMLCTVIYRADDYCVAVVGPSKKLRTAVEVQEAKRTFDYGGPGRAANPISFHKRLTSQPVGYPEAKIRNDSPLVRGRGPDARCPADSSRPASVRETGRVIPVNPRSRANRGRVRCASFYGPFVRGVYMHSASMQTAVRCAITTKGRLATCVHRLFRDA
ncbi:hypothetical protein EVAR_12991_1 [Eumeta japonica]|uniref:Uncharacterized protein n=1 Tax=Eumeta variegata TaxID=151549 RepID=A0A4C1TX16_EUMVA|nr:hypothetical protein EVAR_12991_1 [Eumeta japonica]